MKAIECYQRALKLSPDYAEAHAGLASALCQAPVYVAYPGTDAWPRVRAHASRALRLDPGLGDAHAALGLVTLCCDYEWTRAQHLFVQALELEASSYVLRQLYALYYLTSLGRADDALSLLDRARDDNPDVPGITVFCGMSAVFGRQFERGLREADFVIEGQPMFVQAYWVRGMALEGLGDLDGAIKTFERGVEMTNRSSLFLSQLARACATSGDRKRATQILSELDERAENGGPGSYFTAEVHAALGNTELALDRLYAAYRQRNPLMVFAGVLFGLDPLRGTRRFRDLLMRLGLPAYDRARQPAVSSFPAYAR
jgi:serine/threonine-protein kinase